MPFLMSFALEHEIVTLAWIDNASVQFPLNIYATKGFTLDARKNCRRARPDRAQLSAEARMDSQLNKINVRQAGPARFLSRIDDA